MIVFDENIRQKVVHDTSGWYKGKVTTITTLRVDTVIKDEAIPSILRTVRQATFVTNNIFDFWRKSPAHRAYCIICFVLPNARMDKIPDRLRKIFPHARIQNESRSHG